MKKFGENSSGQLLIVASLAIALLISSTIVYVYEISKEKNGNFTLSINDFVYASKQSVRNAVISSLANASRSGEKTVLMANLNRLSQAFRRLTHFGICKCQFTVFNNSNYDLGVWLSVDDGLGVSSAYANFTFEVYSLTVNITMNYAINITTHATVNGYYTRIGEKEKMVYLTCKVYNEGEPALAKNISVFYEDLGMWVPVNASIMDFGNGTYTITFSVLTSSNSVRVSAHISDLRDIIVMANATCFEA
ncbi:MAG: hypothetical protein QW270_03460 [Candidatus Bathyarchaeia archaeon]